MDMQDVCSVNAHHRPPPMEQNIPAKLEWKWRALLLIALTELISGLSGVSFTEEPHYKRACN